MYAKWAIVAIIVIALGVALSAGSAAKHVRTFARSSGSFARATTRPAA